MMWFTRGASIEIMTAVLPLAGCVSVLKSGPPDNLYRFGIVEDPAHEAHIIERDKKPVTLGRVRFAPEIDGDRILTAHGDTVLYIKDACWVASVPGLFTQAVMRRFEQATSSVRLLPAAARGNGAPLLHLTIDRFEADYRGNAQKSDAPTIRVSGSATLVDSASLQPIASRRFTVDERASASSQSAITSAFDRAVSHYTLQILEWCEVVH